MDDRKLRPGVPPCDIYDGMDRTVGECVQTKNRTWREERFGARQCGRVVLSDRSRMMMGAGRFGAGVCERNEAERGGVIV
jgi:hypothetical protein